MARQTDRLANGNIPYHGCHAQFRNGGWPGAGSSYHFREFESSLVQEFKLFLEFHKNL